MVRGLIGLSLLCTGMAASAQTTDWGVRTIASLPPEPVREPRTEVVRAGFTQSFSLSAATALASRFGRVTSTHRSPEHNRRVGGVPNSWHLAGRAIDIARAPGVSHGEIAAAFRAAGYHLIESLDEGDHTHLAFGNGLGPRLYRSSSSRAPEPASSFTFRVVSR